MIKPWKKWLSATVTLAILAGVLCTGAFAAEEASEADPYVYEYVAGSAESYFSYAARTAKPPEWEEHQYDVTDPEQLSTSVWYGDYDVTRHHPFRMYQLENIQNEGEPAVAYCNDFLTGAVLNHRYRRVNLEDSTYFNETTAAHVRGILLNGYWIDWTREDLKRAEEEANAWLDTVVIPAVTEENEAGEEVVVTPAVRNKDKTPWNPPEDISGNYPGDAEDAVEMIDGLTAAEAQVATQMAIWGITYDQFPYWVDFVMSGEENGVASNGKTAYVLSEPSDNIKAFRKYLLHQTAVPMTREELIISDDYFVENSAVLTVNGADPLTINYDVSLRFKLAGEVDDKDKLEVTAVLGEQRSTCALADLEADGNGYYTMDFQGVEAGDHQIELFLSGTQYVEGVCFYQAKPTDREDKRSATQNLVGKAQGNTPVSAAAVLEFSVGNVQAGVYKLDQDTGLPLAGAVFSLYADVGEADLLVQSGLTTDETGYTPVISGLPSEYDYYFVEERAPEGYSANLSARYPVSAAQGGSSSVVVENERQIKTDPPGGGPGTSIVTPARWVLEANKTLDGKPAGGFSFVMEDPDGNTVTAQSRENGKIVFPAFYYRETGTYTYTVREENKGETDVEYDGAVYTVTVEIDRRGDNHLVKQVKIFCDGAEVEEVIFRNEKRMNLPEEPQDPPMTEDPPAPEQEEQLPETEVGTEERPQPDAEAEEQLPAGLPKTGDRILAYFAVSCLSGIGVFLARRAEKRK